MRAAIALTRLSKRERRTVSLALALLVGGVVLGRGGPALAEWTARARLERDALADSLVTLRDLAVWQRGANGRATPSRSHRNAALRAPNRAMAEARLMSLLTDACDESGLQVNSQQIVLEPALRQRRGAARDTEFERVSLRLSGSGDLDALTSILSFVDTTRTAVTLRSMTLSPRNRVGMGGASAAQLTVDMVVATLWVVDSTAAEDEK